MTHGRSEPLGSPLLVLWLALLVSALPAAAGEVLPLPGDPVAGRRLFTGEQPLRHGGAACIACHAVRGLSGGGGTLGPDLSTTFADFGAEALDSSLVELPFETMKPLYEKRPLTAEERAGLSAFLKGASEGASQAGAETTTAALALGGFAVLLSAAHAVYRRRLGGVRKPLLERRNGRGGAAG